MTDRVINIDMAYADPPLIDLSELSALLFPSIMFGLATVVVVWAWRTTRDPR